MNNEFSALKVEKIFNAKSILDINQWIAQADNLHHAAELLANQQVRPFWLTGGDIVSNPTYTYMMMVGYSLENLLKAVIVKNLTDSEREVVLKTGELPGYMKMHCSDRLFKRSGLPLSQEELRQVERLERAVIWRGRYPATLKPAGRIYSKNGNANLTDTWSNDVENFESFYKKIRKVVIEQVYKGNATP